MSTPKYVERIARLPEVFEVLAAHPAGLPLARLADEVGVPADELREDLLAFYSADLPPDLLLGLSRPETLEFLGPDGEDEDPNDAEVVRISDPRPFDELGVEYVDAAELALIYTAAQALHDIEPDNAELSQAMDVLAETMAGEADHDGEEPQPMLAPLQRAQRERRRTRILYSRAWASGVNERVIEPYRLVQTRRGWEVDAGPLGDRDQVWTYLLSNIRSVDVLDETFELPADLPTLLADQRATETVRLRVPHGGRWAADLYAEQVRVVADGELDVTLDLELLPPIDQRLGLLVLVSGGEVLSPQSRRQAAADLADTLWRHHAHD